jgi:hypothetical protein
MTISTETKRNCGLCEGIPREEQLLHMRSSTNYKLNLKETKKEN